MGVTPLPATVRPPLVDGLFYPGRRETLAATIDDLLEQSHSQKAAHSAIISPHAGYELAGDVMAATFRSICLRPVRTAVLIGPAHREGEDALYLPESEAFGTPLGEVPVDTRSVASLCACDPLFRVNDIPHLEEHCLEVQLPFLSRLYPGLSIVPVLVAGGRISTATALARALQLTFSVDADYTVFVVTANVASYMTGKDLEVERDLMESLLARADWRGIMAAAEKRQVSACCVAGIAAVLSLASPGSVQVVARARSSVTAGDDTRCVYYAGVSADIAARQSE